MYNIILYMYKKQGWFEWRQALSLPISLSLEAVKAPKNSE